MAKWIKTLGWVASYFVIGGLIFWWVSWLVGLIFPSASKYVFILLSIFWLWTGWASFGHVRRMEKELTRLNITKTIVRLALRRRRSF